MRIAKNRVITHLVLRIKQFGAKKADLCKINGSGQMVESAQKARGEHS